MFKHLLVPIDGSPLSESTIGRALSFARDASAKVTFFFAKPEYPLAFYGEGALIDPTTPEQFAQMADQQAHSILDAAAGKAKAAGVAAETRSSVSDAPWVGIIAAADEVGADLVFMASHGRRGLSGLLLGSETHKVLTHSKIPVLIYR